jgi:hypothetical protein
MIELFKSLNNRAEKIADMMVADIVDDAELLTVALCAGNLSEIARTLHAKRLGKNKHKAAHNALELGLNPIKRDAVVSKGYFAEGLRGLLDLAEKNPDAGTRLMPIFGEMADNCKKYGIPKKLKVRVKNYMTEKKKRDGFAITLYDDTTGSIIVHAADWVSDMLLD